MIDSSLEDNAAPTTTESLEDNHHRRYQRRCGQTHFELLRPAVLVAIASREDATGSLGEDSLLSNHGCDVLQREETLLSNCLDVAVVASGSSEATTEMQREKRGRRVSYQGHACSMNALPLSEADLLFESLQREAKDTMMMVSSLPVSPGYKRRVSIYSHDDE
jgi:hypothetical protein